MKKGSISFIPHNNEDKRKLLVLIEKEANIASEEEFYQSFIGFIDNFDYFYIKIDNIESFDLSFLQLLISIKKTIEKTNKVIEFEINLPDNIKSILYNSGVDLRNLFDMKNN